MTHLAVRREVLDVVRPEGNSVRDVTATLPLLIVSLAPHVKPDLLLVQNEVLPPTEIATSVDAVIAVVTIVAVKNVRPRPRVAATLIETLMSAPLERNAPIVRNVTYVERPRRRPPAAAIARKPPIVNGMIGTAELVPVVAVKNGRARVLAGNVPKAAVTATGPNDLPARVHAGPNRAVLRSVAGEMSSQLTTIRTTGPVVRFRPSKFPHGNMQSPC